MEFFEDLIFHKPLYAESSFEDFGTLSRIFLGTENVAVDGYCLHCKNTSTFQIEGFIRDPIRLVSMGRSEDRDISGFQFLQFACARNGSHKLSVWLHVNETKIKKIGQLPSLVELATGEKATYSGVLDASDADELHRAIGLAAHGIGIGSFVYLRRIFERLILNRYERYKDDEGWDNEVFMKSRMDEKIKLLSNHLPSFLVENRRIYSILSKGIHELSEQECLDAFDSIHLSLKIILNEDLKTKEDLKLKDLATAAISKFPQ